MNKIIYEKVEFELPEGWKININNLFKIEIEKNDDKIWDKFSEDMFNMVNSEKKLIIDVGWYPQFDVNGHFGLIVIKDNVWLKPIDTLVTRDINEIINKINAIIHQ